MHLKDRILISIGRRKDKAFLRQEFNGFGPRNSVDKAVRALVKDGRLVRLGYGVYAPAIDGKLAVDQVEAVMQALTKLDAKPKPDYPLRSAIFRYRYGIGGVSTAA